MKDKAIIYRSSKKRYRAHRLRQCLSCSKSIDDFFFHLGYQGLAIPRRIRKVIAKSNLHKSWLNGYTGAGVAKAMERQKWKFEDEITY